MDGKSVLYLGEMQTLNRKLGHDLELLTHIMTSFYTKEYIYSFSYYTAVLVPD